MTTPECAEVPGADAERLMPILDDAEEDDDRIQAALGEQRSQAYSAYAMATGHP